MANTTRTPGKYESLYTDPAEAAAWAEVDELTARTFDLERMFTYDRTSPTSFRWTGTPDQFAELETLRAAIAAHPVVVADAAAEMRAEARMV